VIAISAGGGDMSQWHFKVGIRLLEKGHISNHHLGEDVGCDAKMNIIRCENNLDKLA